MASAHFYSEIIADAIIAYDKVMSALSYNRLSL